MIGCKDCEHYEAVISELRKQLGMSTSDELYVALKAWNMGVAAGEMIRDLQAQVKRLEGALAMIQATGAMPAEFLQFPVSDDLPYDVESPNTSEKVQQGRPERS